MKAKNTRSFLKEVENRHPNLFKELYLLSEYKSSNVKILVYTKHGLCNVVPRSLIDGVYPTIRSAINKTDYFKRKLLLKNPNFFDDNEIIGEYTSSKINILIKSKYGDCKMTPEALLFGSIPSIVSAVNKTEYFINQLKDIHGDKYNYNSTVYVNDYDLIKIICKKHKGEFEISPTSLLQGSGCKKCGTETTANKRRKGKEKFIEEANIIHNNKYTYDNVIYTNNRTDVEITCPIHGDFSQKPSQHILSKSICPQCSHENHDGLYNMTIANRNIEDWKNTQAIVYIIKCHNEKEEFYKIGITKNTIANRFKSNLEMPYSYEVVDKVNTNLYMATILEKELHKSHKDLSYRPLIKFGGYTECFSNLDMNIINKSILDAVGGG